MGLEFNPGRRKFLKGSALLTATAFAAIKLGVDLSRTSQNPGPPSRLSGMIPNCHHLPYENDSVQRALIKNLEMSRVICTRVFLDDIFEPELGSYRYEKIEQIIKLSKRIPITVDLFDAYYFLHADKANPAFESISLSSPYLVAKGDRDIPAQQRAIFTDPEIRSRYMERIRVAGRVLVNVPGVVGVGLANELNIRMRNHQRARSMHTSLFKEAVDNLLEIGWDRAIFIGVDDPNLIDEEKFREYETQVINTYHAYPWQPHLGMIRTYRQQSEHILPLVCQEVGLPRRVLQPNGSVLESPDYDEEYSRFLLATLARFSEYDEESRMFIPLISGFGPWRISAEGDSHKDNYEIEPDKMPKTMRAFNKVLTTLSYSANSAV